MYRVQKSYEEWVTEIRELNAEIARLRARPTEEEVALVIQRAHNNKLPQWPIAIGTAVGYARAVLALFPKVQP